MNKDSPEINEIPDLENQNFDKKFRRTNDAVQYQVFVSILKAYEKTLNLLKYTLIIIAIAIIFVYNSFSNDTTREDYQTLLLNDIILKLDDLKKNQIGTNTNQIDKTKLLKNFECRLTSPANLLNWFKTTYTTISTSITCFCRLSKLFNTA